MHKLNQDDQLSYNFKRSEFACKCGCGFSSVDSRLVSVLQNLRNTFEKPVEITSACRCESHNKSVGGAKNSAHLYGLAADVVVHGKTQVDIAKWFDHVYLGQFGIGTYNTFTHIDIRAEKARW